MSYLTCFDACSLFAIVFLIFVNSVSLKSPEKSSLPKENDVCGGSDLPVLPPLARKFSTSLKVPIQ